MYNNETDVCGVVDPEHTLGNLAFVDFVLEN